MVAGIHIVQKKKMSGCCDLFTFALLLKSFVAAHKNFNFTHTRRALTPAASTHVCLLARFMFFVLCYPGINDLCRCFSCDGGLQRWEAGDDPWTEHAHWFPHCRFVIDTKGQSFIDMIQAQVARDQYDVEVNFGRLLASRF